DKGAAAQPFPPFRSVSQLNCNVTHHSPVALELPGWRSMTARGLLELAATGTHPPRPRTHELPGSFLPDRRIDGSSVRRTWRTPRLRLAVCKLRLQGRAPDLAVYGSSVRTAPGVGRAPSQGSTVRSSRR